MSSKISRKANAVVLAAALSITGVAVAHAKTFGNSLSGASTDEVGQVRYNGAAWNYPGSGHKATWFKYTRGGKTLMHRTATNGKVTGSVWDDLIHWGDNGRTHFNWGRS